MRTSRLALIVAYTAAAVACGGTAIGTGNGDAGGSGAGGGAGSGTGGGSTGSGGTGGGSFALDFSRPSTSTTYDACELSTYRVVTFDRAPGSFDDGFSCDAVAATSTAIQATFTLDFTATGVTPCGTVKAPSTGKVAEVWVLAKAKVKKRGRFHAAHGQLTCTGADGHRYVVLRFAPASAVDMSAAATVRLVAVFDVQRTIVEHGECSAACDEDDEHSEAQAGSDPKHGSISLQSQCSLTTRPD